MLKRNKYLIFFKFEVIINLINRLIAGIIEKLMQNKNYFNRYSNRNECHFY